MIFLNSHEQFRVAAPALEKMQGKAESPSLDALYELAGADSIDRFAFTASGAEAINQVHWTAFLELARKEGKCHFLTTPTEDSATLLSLKRLEALGCFVKIVPLDAKGQVDLPELAKLLTPRTALLSLSLAHALTGVIQPMEEIVQMAHSSGVWVHVDATYALGKMYSPFRQMGADYLTFGGGAIHSVKGSGGVFAKAQVPLLPFILGDTSDPATLSALETAARHALLSFDQMGLEVVRLRDYFESRIEGAEVLFQDGPRLPNVSLLSFPKVHQAALHHALKQKGLFASIGGAVHPHLHRHLLACKCSEQTALTACSFALSRFTTEEEIDQAIDIVNRTVRSLQALTEDLVFDA